MPNKLTDAEVKKALECCGEYSDCPHICPLRDMAYVGDCIQVKAKAALDLINRLETENEKNENIIRIADKTIATLQAENESLKAEVERLQSHIQEGIDLAKQIPEMLALTKAEAYKECIDKAKLQCNKIPQYHFNLLNVEWYLDNLLNELVGDGDG